MKVVLQAFIASIVVHIVFLAGTMLVGYIKTKTYKPDMEGAWDNAETLQSEVAFGSVQSPFLYIYTIVGVAIVCGVLLLLYKKFA